LLPLTRVRGQISVIGSGVSVRESGTERLEGVV
jgi:hypothetical protein